ncbi:hypothetical protein [Rathayibacter iranicus]|uniref:Uncharacterized protein n=1 Tax=Rathayibacter iranicus TaxID=59737 RepID=A0AAD1ELG0_9MICO|nr:hypothetical protein [Rathayibacter iranicus]AZZ54600.1 hypothetical protein C7V51_00885 [Rathayibacter iranicus]
MVLRLDPRLPLLWRSAHSVQLGLDRPHVVLEGVGYPEELLLDALRIGTSAGTVRLIARRAGASDARVDDVLAALRPVLVRTTEPGPPRPRASWSRVPAPPPMRFGRCSGARAASCWARTPCRI